MGITTRHAVLAAALLAAVVAAPSIRNGFVGDDHWVIEQRPFLQHPPSLGAVLVESYWPASFGGSLWRPAVLLSYALDYRVSANPRWFHGVNVAWAAIATALLTLLACELAGPIVGLIAGLLFAVHPVHVEAIANVVGRAELMAAAAYAAALVCALRARERPLYVIGVALCGAFAIASKELAATLPAAIVLVYALRRTPLAEALKPVAVSLIPIAAYYIVHQSVGGGDLSAGGVAPGLEHLGVVQRTWAMLPLSLEWWRLLLFPVHLAADYSPGDVTVSTGVTAAHLVALLVWSGLAVLAWRSRRTIPGVAFGLVWLIVTISPVANVVLPTELLIAERTLYLPSFGVVFALAVLGLTVRWSRRGLWTAVAVIVVLAGVRSIARIPVWHDDEALYQAQQRDAPRSYRTLWMVGKDEFQAGRWGSGERMLREAIAHAPAVTGPRIDLARFYANAGLWRPAAEQLAAATAADSGSGAAWALLPRALLAARDTAGALAAAREALRRFPHEHDIVQSATGVLDSIRPPPR